MRGGGVKAYPPRSSLQTKFKGVNDTGIFNITQEKKIQLYFGDNRHFKFIPRLMDFTCLIEKKNGDMVRAWKHFYSTELPFAGYRNIPSAMVTPGFSRDVILDIFNQIPEKPSPGHGEKPQKTTTSIMAWISRIATNQRQTFRTKRKTSFMANYIIWTEIGIIVVMLIVWALRSLM